MTTIELPAHCKNSPRSSLICELLEARTTQNFEFLREWCTSKTVWDIVGDRSLNGLEEIIAAASTAFDRPVEVLTIDTALTHGKFAAATGTFHFGTIDCWRFSEIFEFCGHSKASKLRMMSSYWIESPTVS